MPTVCPMQISKNRWIYAGSDGLIEYYMMIEVIWNELHNVYNLWPNQLDCLGVAYQQRQHHHRHRKNPLLTERKPMRIIVWEMLFE